MIPGLSACGPSGNKTASVSIIYAIAAAVSLLLLMVYCCLNRKKEVWFLLLFACIFIVNTGYFALSISGTLEEALLANRIAYLGSAFLPMAMQMIIANVTKLNFKKWIPYVLFGIGVAVFFIAATPGYLDIYYKEVSFHTVNGVGSLEKVYGDWHCVYMFYLIGYFVAMVATIVYPFVKKALDSTVHSVLLALAVFVNLCVWFIEQMVRFDFEFLAISYIISGSFLLGIDMIVSENERLKEIVKEQEISNALEALEKKEESDKSEPQKDTENRNKPDEADRDRYQLFVEGVEKLTNTERAIYESYLKRITTKEIMATLGIKENTLKFHNKNIYSKLSVSSRKELVEIYKKENLRNQW